MQGENPEKLNFFTQGRTIVNFLTFLVYSQNKGYNKNNDAKHMEGEIE